MSTGHTPVPWVCHHPTLAWHIRKQVGEGGGQLIAVVEYQHHHEERQEADARLIVRAVNAHAALVDACEAALETLDHAEVNRWEQEVADRLRAALALAKGESSP